MKGRAVELLKIWKRGAGDKRKEREKERFLNIEQGTRNR